VRCFSPRGLLPHFKFCLRHRIIQHVINHFNGLRKLYSTNSSGMLYDLAGSRTSKWRTPDRNYSVNTYLSVCRQHLKWNLKGYSYVFKVHLSNKTTGDFVRVWLNRKWKIQDGGLQTGSTFVTACRQYINEVPTAISVCEFQLPNKTINNVVRSNWKWTLKKAPFISEVPVSQLVNKIGTKCQRLYLCFRCPAIPWDYQECCTT